MKVKNKLRLGFGFLFIVMLCFGAVALFYINQISGNAKIILKDNYESLNFLRTMRAILDEQSLPLNEASVTRFNTQLVKEERNLTEPGERQAVQNLRASFIRLKTASATLPQMLLAEKAARQALRKIELVNMQAIVRKNDAAQTSVDRAAVFLGLAGSFTFLVLFSFSLNFPGFISNPLQVLLEGIRAIGQKNYNQRIHFDHKDEFAEVADAFNEMAARLDDWENSNLSKVISEKVRIETIIEQMHDAIIGINEQQEILFINSAAKNIFNLQGQKLSGKSVSEISKNHDLLKSITEEAPTGKPIKIFSGGKDAYFQLEVREILVPNLNGKTSAAMVLSKITAGKVYILRNITEFKELDEAKTNFIATISHELKTPIAAMKMSLKLLADTRVGPLNTEQGELVQHINDDAERLLKITHELLNLSQVETGNIQLNFISAKPQQILDYAIKAIRFEAEQKGVQLIQSVAEALPNIQADVEKTAWVMINFLSNALRYSALQSKIVVEVLKKGKMIEFAVQDFGKGIEQQYKERLFDRYFQVPADGQNKSGSGLGLAISKEFILAQNGAISVESILGEGSRFSFRLPVMAE